MYEVCFCGRTGNVEDRSPTIDTDGTRALECPNCGHQDRLEWLSEEARDHTFRAAERKQAARREAVAVA